MNQQIEMLEKAARVLEGVSDRIVFTGGATISLYLDEASAPDIRPTYDVDCAVEITSRAEYYRFSEQLRQLGLTESTDAGAPLCRWQYEELTIDIMPGDESVLGFSNPWYKTAIANSIPYQMPSGRQILIFAPPYLLASKIEAFKDRGKSNFYWSSDLEDIVLLLDGCSDLEVELERTDVEVRTFLAKWFAEKLETLREVAPAFLSSIAINSGREQLLIERIERIAGMIYLAN